MSTTQQYLSLDVAYQYYNKHLFEETLPTCLITLQRKKCYGYFSPDRFSGKNGHSNQKTDEIALNPDHFGRTDKAVLGTLVHEMVHLWQNHYGEQKSRKSYHNKEWADKMESLGLMPSHTGEPGGKRTGQHMTHYIIEDGIFDTLTTHLLSIQGGIIEWKSFAGEETPKKPRTKSKVKYSCPECGQNAWAKPGALFICGVCQLDMGEQG